MEQQKKKVHWSTQTMYIDIDTGEILDSREATNTNKFYIVKKEKNATFNKEQQRGIIHYSKYYKRQAWKQLELS